MKRIICTTVLFCIALSASNALAQSVNGSVSGLVRDTTKAVIPGVTITLTGSDTGVVTTVLSNDTGAYNFASVLPGTYKLSAELTGFKGSVINEVKVGTSAQVRLDVVLELGASDTKVEVSVSSQQLLTESSASVGEVLPAN